MNQTLDPSPAPAASPAVRAPAPPVLARIQALEHGGRGERFVGGLTLPLHAARFLFAHRALWPLVIVPALINLVIFALVAGLLVLNAGTVLGWLWAQPQVEAMLDRVLLVLWYLALVLVMAVGLVLAYFTTLLVGGVVASPFNDTLSQRTEEVLTGRVVNLREGESTLAGAVRGIATSLLTLGLYLGCTVPLLVLHLVPGVGSVLYTALATSIGAFFLALEFSDSALDRAGYGFGQKVRRVREEFAVAGGFGAGTSLLLFIPILNLLAMPVAVVGGTILGLAIRDWSASQT